MNENSTIIESRNDNPNEKKERRGFFIYLIFAVICSLVLWFYVAGVDTDMAEKKFTGLTIELRNESQMKENTNFAVLSGAAVPVDITVTGRRSDISRMKSSDVKVWVDLSTVKEAGANKLTLYADVPDGMNFSCYPQSVTIYTDEAITKDVPVKVQILNMYKAHDLEMSEPVLSRNQVSVTGPANLLETITEATLSLDLGTVTQSFDIDAHPVLRDKDGKVLESPYLKWKNDTIRVTYTLAKTKELNLAVNFKNGYLTMNDVELIANPPTLRVKGEPKLIDEMDDTLVIQTVDETQLKTEGNDYVISAAALKLPSEVEIVDSVVLEEGLSFSLTPKNARKELQIPLNQPQGNVVEVSGLSEDLMPAFKKDFLTVVLRGDEAVLAAITPEQVKLVINLTEYNAVGEKRNVPVKVEFASYSQAYVVGTYTVDVEVSVKPAPLAPDLKNQENIL